MKFPLDELVEFLAIDSPIDKICDIRRHLQISDPRPSIEQADVDKIVAACLAAMGEVAFLDAYDEGQEMSLEEAVAFALKDLDP